MAIPTLATLELRVEEAVAFIVQFHRANVRLIVAEDIDTATADGTEWVAGIGALARGL